MATRSSDKNGKSSKSSKRSNRSTPSKSRRLPIVDEMERKSVPCLSCGLCCTYVAVEVDDPTNMTNAQEILFYLYHERTTVYWDNDEEWLVQFETRCDNLEADLTCAIYEYRPGICRSYSEKSCEVNAEDEGTTFTNAADFLSFLQTKRKRVFRKLEEKGYVPPEGMGHGNGTPRHRKHVPYVRTFRKLRKLGVS